MERGEQRQDTIELLTEIRDLQRRAVANQESQLELVREQIERSKSSIEESIRLQRAAMLKMKQGLRIALPAVLFCIVLIGYLVIRYF